MISVFSTGGHQGGLVGGMGSRFGGGDEARADADGGCTRRESGRHRTRRADSAGGDDGDADFLDDSAEERQEGELTADMSAGGDALGDDVIATGFLSRDGFLERTCLPANQRAALMDALDEFDVGLIPEEFDDLDAVAAASTASVSKKGIRKLTPNGWLVC